MFNRTRFRNSVSAFAVTTAILAAGVTGIASAATQTTTTARSTASTAPTASSTTAAQSQPGGTYKPPADVRIVHVDAFPGTDTADAGTCDFIANRINAEYDGLKWDLNHSPTDAEIEGHLDQIDGLEDLALDAGCTVIY